MERRLAAILAADVVGYSRLMEQDEAGTLAALRDRRKSIFAPLVTLHRGRIVKLMGDGVLRVLVEFASAVNAVQCAVELQQKMAEANTGLEEAVGSTPVIPAAKPQGPHPDTQDAILVLRHPVPLCCGATADEG